MKICWFGIYDREYSRNHVLIRGLEHAGAVVIECNSYGLPGFKKYWYAIKKLRALQNQYDVLFCAFPINYSVLLAKLLQSRPIVIDAFYPLYDAYVHDRKTVKKWSLKGLVYYWLDWANLRLADLIITDTIEHQKYWHNHHKNASFAVIPVGAPSDQFFPIPHSTDTIKNQCLVSFHGSYIPLQGVDKIIATAELLKHKTDIMFRFIGTKKMCSDLCIVAEGRGLSIELCGWLPTVELNKKLNEADIVLGIFGDTEKTDRVIPNKVFQGMAVGKAVITKDTPEARRVLKDCVLLVQNTPEKIAKAITDLCVDKDRRNSLATRAHKEYQEKYTEKAIGTLLLPYLTQVIDRK